MPRLKKRTLHQVSICLSYTIGSRPAHAKTLDNSTLRMKNAPIVGTSVPRMEGRAKVTGEARYVDDMVLPGMLYGATVRSRIPRGKIKAIHLRPRHRLERIRNRHARGHPRKKLHRAHRR